MVLTATRRGRSDPPQLGPVLGLARWHLKRANSDAGLQACITLRSLHRKLPTTRQIRSRLFLPRPGSEAAVAPFERGPTLTVLLSRTHILSALAQQKRKTQTGNRLATVWSLSPTRPPDRGKRLNFRSRKIDNQRFAASHVIADNVRLTRGNIFEVSDVWDVGVDIGAMVQRVGVDPASLTIGPALTLFGGSGAGLCSS